MKHRYIHLFILTFLFFFVTAPLTNKVFSESIVENFYKSYTGNTYRQFGYDIFKSSVSSQKMVVGPDYILGPKDTVNIKIWGDSLTTIKSGMTSQKSSSTTGNFLEYSLNVDSKGNLIFPEIGFVPVNGVTFGKLEHILALKYRQYCKDCSVALAIPNPRHLQILITGQVNKPGYVQVIQGSSLFDALLATGGISKSGSLRTIRLKHQNGLSEEIDLYDFISTGELSSFPTIKEKDTIHINPIGPVALLKGVIRKKGIFELKSNEVLPDLVSYAGGLYPDTNSDHIEHISFKDTSRKLSHISLNSKITIQDGDSFNFIKKDIRIKNAIHLKGHVVAPKSYAWSTGVKLKDILYDIELLKSEAAMDYGEIVRYDMSKLHKTIHTFKPKNLFKNDGNSTGDANISLQPYDEIIIYSKEAIEQLPIMVTIKGAVKKPGKYKWMENITLLNLIQRAGGLKPETAMDYGEIVRYDTSKLHKTIHTFRPERVLKSGENPASNSNISLQPYDKIIIYSKEAIEQIPMVTITGAVKKPGKYKWLENITLLNIIQRAGGVQNRASDQGSIVRYNLKKNKWETTIIPFSVNQIKIKPQKNIPLEALDRITIPEQRDFNQTRWQATISGEINYPGTYPIGPKTRLCDLIKLAGFVTDSADLSGLSFKRTQLKNIQSKFHKTAISLLKKDIVQKASEASNHFLNEEERLENKQATAIIQNYLSHLETTETSGRLLLQYKDLASTETLKGSESDILLTNNDVITIPAKKSFVTIVGEVFSPASYLFKKKYEVSDYLKFAGGISPYGDQEASFILRVDGSVVSYSQLKKKLFSLTMRRGDVLVIPSKVLRASK